MRPTKDIGPPADAVRFGPFLFNIQTGELYREDIRLKLSGHAIEILRILVVHPGQLVTREELQNRLWPNDEYGDFEHGLNAAVNRLRENLLDSVIEPKYIETVPRRGYRFIATFGQIEDEQTSTPSPSLPNECVSDNSLTNSSNAVRDQEPASNSPWQVFGQVLAKARKHRFGLAFVCVSAILGVFTAIKIWDWWKRPLMPDPKKLKIVQVTDDGGFFDAAVFPDGRYVAAAHVKGGKYSVWLHALGNGGATQVVQAGDLPLGGISVSPDNAYLYFLRRDKNGDRRENLYRVPALGGSPHELMRNIATRATFSPDGRRFAAMRLQPDRNHLDILLANIDGAEQQTVTTLPYDDGEISNLSWSPDGHLLATSIYDQRKKKDVLKLISIANGSVSDLYSSSELIRAVAWVPNGKGLLFLGSEKNPDRVQVFFVSYPGGHVESFTRDLTNYDECCISITRDGSRVVTIGSRFSFALWLVPGGDAGQARPLTFTGSSYEGLWLDWESEGKIATVSADALVSTRLEAVQRTELLPKRAGPFSTCGSYIVYATYNSTSGIGSVWRMDEDASNSIQLTEPTVTAGLPDCSKDADFVVYSSNGSLVRNSINGEHPTELAKIPNQVLTYARISPDGKRIVYGGTELANGVEKYKLLIIDAGTGALLQTLERPSGARFVKWSASGNALQFTRTMDGIGNVWELPLNGAVEHQLTRFTSEDARNFAWSRDGKNLLISRGNTLSDVVLITD